MQESFIIYTINTVLEGLKYRYNLSENLYRLGCEDNNDLNEIGNNFINIAWQTIIEARDIPEINLSEFECFSDMVYDIVEEGYGSFDWENQHYSFKNGKDLWEYFKGDHIEDFFDDDIKNLKN